MLLMQVQICYKLVFMRVSVIIPTFNRAATITRALGSVLKQNVGAGFKSTPTIEVIIIDDGSTDGTRDLIVGAGFPRPIVPGAEPPAPTGSTTRMGRRLRTDRPGGTAPLPIKYLYQPNRGPAAARNLGIHNSGGEFIAFLDSDDEWLPGKLAAQLQFFQDRPDYLISQTEEIWFRNGRRVNPMKKHKKYGGWIFEKCLPLCIVSPSAVMVRREFFDRVGLFDESLPACEDYDLWLRASACLPIGLVRKPYVMKYGGHSDQRSRQFPVMDRFRIRSLRNILESDLLDPVQREAALRELKRKCQIVSQGAAKRGKSDEARYYAEEWGHFLQGQVS